MLRKSASSLLAAALLIALGACEADREAAEQVDPAPNPAIEAAPATPTPPVGVPPVGTESARQRMDADTLPVDTLNPDTAPRMPRVP